MNQKKEYEAIGKEDLEDFAIYHNNRLRSESAKLIMLRAACLLKLKGSNLPLITCTRSLSYSERQDYRWFNWYLTDAEVTQLIQILALNLEVEF